MSENSKPIQSPPLGLLGLLNLKNTGNNPDTMAGYVQPTLDLMDMYFIGQAQAIGGQLRTITAGPTPGFYPWDAGTGPITVPQSEVWKVHRYSLAGNTAAATTASGFRAAYQNFNGLTFLMGEPAMSLAALETKNMYAEDFWLPPGSSLGFVIGGATGGNTQFAVTGLLYTPIRI